METLSSAMNVLTRAGIVILEVIFYHPAVSAILCCAALALLCRIDGGARPLFAFAAYCALTAAVYLAGAKFIGMGALALLALTLALFPVIFGAFWGLARRRFRCAKKYKTEEESK